MPVTSAGDGRGYSFCGGAEAGRGSGGAGGLIGADSARAGVETEVWGVGGYCGECVAVGEAELFGTSTLNIFMVFGEWVQLDQECGNCGYQRNAHKRYEHCGHDPGRCLKIACSSDT